MQPDGELQMDVGPIHGFGLNSSYLGETMYDPLLRQRQHPNDAHQPGRTRE
jgi:hypothetical protein